MRRKHRREKLAAKTPKAPIVYRGGPLSCSIHYNEYGGYCVPKAGAKHCVVAKAIRAGKVHEPDTIKYLMDHCGDGSIIHAGALWGDFLPALSKALAPGRKLWAFEPNLESFRCAEITIKINGLENVVLVRAALGSTDGQAALVSAENGHAAGCRCHVIGGIRGWETGYTQQVRQLVLDELPFLRQAGRGRDPVGRDLFGKISILQLDVQGYEQQALAGAFETLKRDRPILILEVHHESALVGTPWFRDNILSLGYYFQRNLHNNYVYVCPQPAHELE